MSGIKIGIGFGQWKYGLPEPESLCRYAEAAEAVGLDAQADSLEKLGAEKADPAACFRDSPFGPLAFETFERWRQLSGAEVVELYSTVSAVASLPVSERAELKRELPPLLGDAYRLKIMTVLYWGRRG